MFDSLDDQLMHSVAQQSTVVGSSVALAAHSLNSPEFWSHTRAHNRQRRSQFNSDRCSLRTKRFQRGFEQRELERGVAKRNDVMRQERCRLNRLTSFSSPRERQRKREEIRDDQNATMFNTSKRDSAAIQLGTRSILDSTRHSRSHAQVRTLYATGSLVISSMITGSNFEQSRALDSRTVESTRTSVESDFSRCTDNPRTDTEDLCLHGEKPSRRSGRIDMNTRRNRRKREREGENFIDTSHK